MSFVKKRKQLFIIFMKIPQLNSACRKTFGEEKLAREELLFLPNGSLFLYIQLLLLQKRCNGLKKLVGVGRLRSKIFV